jgi:hypothetical protein
MLLPLALRFVVELKASSKETGEFAGSFIDAVPMWFHFQVESYDGYHFKLDCDVYDASSLRKAA